MKKLWQKENGPLADVERFTVGRDREMDLYLAKYDIIGSLAHAEMLRSVGLLRENEATLLYDALNTLLGQVENGLFTLEDGVEDVHSQVELLLTRMVGDAGKNIHIGRSRNDQVLTDIKLFLRHEIVVLAQNTETFFHALIAQSERFKQHLMPGYTHFQVGMVSSFGMWFGAYAEALCEDLYSLEAAYRLANKNPLGSAAGYGSSFPLDRALTTRLLDFEQPHVNALNAQMSRGKTEKFVAQALANIAATLTKMAYDCCMFMSSDMAFMRFPDELTTGSSIMPHKKNPDVFELVRARCNSLQALPNEIVLMTNNLPSGYHRDFQLIKEKIFPAFEVLNDCLRMMQMMLERVEIQDRILEQEKYKYLFTVEEINRLFLSGVPFRDAYRQVGAAVEEGRFERPEMLPHTHLGSIGNLGNEQILAQMAEIMAVFKPASQG